MFLNHIFKYFKIGFIFTFGLLSTLIAQQPVILTDESENYLLGMNLEILEDSSGQLSIEDITAPEYDKQFTPSQEEIPRYGYTKSVFWIRLKIMNERSDVSRSPWALELAYPNMQYVNLYQLSDEGKVVKMTKTGTMRSIQTRDYPYPRFVFILQLPRHSEQTIYLRFQNEASMTLPLILRTITEFMKESQETHALNGIFMGILLIMIGYYLFLFFSLKDQSYLYFALFTISLLLFNLSYTGVTYLYFWPNLVWWNRLTIPIFIGLMNISFLKFTETFLQTKTQMIKLQKTINLLLVVVAFFIILTPVISYRFSIMSMMSLIIISFFLVVSIGYIFYRRGFRPARYFLLSLLPMILSALLLILVRWGFLSSNQITEQGYLIGSVLFMLLLAFALADRIKLFKIEKYIANKNLKESEEKYRTSFESSRDGHVIFKMDKTIVDANPKFIEMCGYEKHELIGMSLPDVVPKADRPETVERMKKLLSGDEISEFETNMQTKNGSEIPVTVNVFMLKNCYGEKIVFQSSGRDITGRKRAEEDLQISDNNLRALINATTDVAFLINADYKIILLNKALANASGKSIEEIRGSNALDLLPPELAGQRKKQMDEAFRSGEPVRWEDSGVLGWSDNSIFPVTDDKGKVTSLAVFSLDISDRKRSEILQYVINNIANAVANTKDVSELYQVIHSELNKLIDATNFFVGLYDEDTNTILLPYMKDEKYEIDKAPAVQTISNFVIKNNQSMLLRKSDIDKLKKENKVSLVGTPCKIWLGVPLQDDGKVIGIIVVQNYENENAYNKSDLELLEFVSKQVAVSIKKKQAEEELKNSEERLKILFEFAPDAYYLNDLKGKFIDGNKESEILLGYKKNELINKNFLKLKLLHPNQIPKAKALLVQNAAGEATGPDEFTLYRKDGSTVTAEIRSYPVKIKDQILVLGIARDISERKKAEERIRILSRSVEQSPASIVITNLEGNIEYVNPKFTEITGYSFEEVKGKNPRILKSEETPKDIHKQLWESISSGGEWKGEFHNKKKNGELFWELAYIAPIKNEQGRTTHYLAVKEDITERKQLQQQLAQSQKMESIGTLAGGIAHDFNNLLTVINGFSDFVLMKLKENDPYYKELSAIHSAGEKATNLTRQILAFSRKQIFHPKIISINEVISDLDNMMRRLIGEDINIDVNLYPDISHIKADPGQIEQILINLLVNARDAINQKTEKASEKKITIETDSIYLDDTFIEKHIGSSIGLHTCFSVKDSGIGMPNETKQKIFDPFFTTKDKGKGTGLGLSTVYGIVKQNSGSIYVYSEQGIGTVFKIYWPASKNKLTTKISEEKTESELQGNESILLVEDDEEVRKFASAALKDFGYVVYPAANGKKAINLVKSKNIKVDLVFTDMIMPDMNGKELSERLKEISPDVDILFASGYADNYIVDSGKLERNINFLQKPYSINVLAKKVRDILDRR